MPVPTSVPSLQTLSPAASRWSASSWLLTRGGGEETISSTGLLGGSQAGLRILYRLNGNANGPVSVSTRLYAPLRGSGAEASLGIEWQPAAGVPLRLLAERRERLGSDGRSAFALLAHGGVSDRPLAAGLRLDAYAQAGIVGARSRDLFADGALTVVRPIAVDNGPGVAVGFGVWGAAQPGVVRLDIGPRIATTIGAAGLRARVALDWRVRVAGDAAPRSGPALTVATDF